MLISNMPSVFPYHIWFFCDRWPKFKYKYSGFFNFLYHSHTKQQALVQPRKNPMTLIMTCIPSTFLVLNLIFFKISFMLSYDSFILAVWANGTDRNLFPLWRSIAFKLTLEESITKRHFVVSCSWRRPFINEQTELQFTK